MTKEIEEKISEEIDIANYKFQQRMIKQTENYQRALDEIDGKPGETKKALECLMAYIIYQKNVFNDFLIEIKAIQEKYEKELQDE